LSVKTLGRGGKEGESLMNPCRVEKETKRGGREPLYTRWKKKGRGEGTGEET